MFTALSERLTATLKRLTGRGVLSEQDVTEALREIRRHLLEADVSFEVTTGFVERVRERAVGVIAVKSVSPGQQVAKLVHDELARMLGASDEDLARKVGAQHAAPLQFAPVGPTVILLVGLQGSGKTTTAAKLARRLKLEQKAPGLVAADPYRPAAGDQLRQLVEQVGVQVFPREQGAGSGTVLEVVQQAVREAEKARCRTVIVDTAGRLQIDAELMDELKALRAATSPREVLLVADGMTGQDAVRIARGFHEGVGLTGAILTKLDGDARGGAALSIHGVTGVPIKFIGTGENVGAQHAAPLLEPFDPVRMAGRILGQGDVVALVEKAAATIDAEAAERLEKKARSKQGMDLADFLVALKQMQAMGPIKQVLGLLPGVNARALKAVNADDKRLKHVEAIVLSMTPDERTDPSILTGSRRLRIAKGAGRTVQEVNRLLEQFQQMRKLLKRTWARYGNSHSAAARGTEGAELLPDRRRGFALSPRRAVRRDLGPLQPAHQSRRHPRGCGASARLARQGGPPDRHGPLAAEEGGSAGQTTRVVGRVRKPHGQRGEVAVFPLVENPGAVFTPKARLLVVNEERQVVAGPLVVARRRAYHREWLLSFVGVKSRADVEPWREHFVAVEETDADD